MAAFVIMPYTVQGRLKIFQNLRLKWLRILLLTLFHWKGWVSNRWIIHEMVQEYGIAKLTLPFRRFMIMIKLIQTAGFC